MPKTKLDHIYGSNASASVDALTNRVNTIETTLNNVPKLNAQNQYTNQNIYKNHSAPLLIQGNNERALQVRNDSANIILKIGKFNNDNKGYIETGTEDLVLKVPSTKKVLIDAPQTELRGPLRMGFGGLNSYILPEDNTQGKSLHFKKDNMGSYHLDMNDYSRIKNLPAPADLKDAIRKKDIKDIVAASSDWADFKRRIGSW